MNDIKGYSILVNKAKGREIEGVTISKLVEDKPAQTIRAEKGEIFFADDGNTLVIRLHNGEVHDVDEKDPKRYLRLKFSEHTLHIPDAGGKLERIEREYRGDREMSINALTAEVAKLERKLAEQEQQVKEIVNQATEDLPDIYASIVASDRETKPEGSIVKVITSAHDRLRTLKNQADSYKRRIRSFSVEIHKKVAISFACMVFVLIGVPIGVRAKEGGASSGLVVSILFFAVYYAFLSAGEKLADRGYVPPYLSMWAANIVLGGLGLWLFLRTNRQLPLIPRPLMRMIRGS